MIRVLSFAAVVVALSLPAPLLAQTGQDSLRGCVKDAQGGVLPGATVTATSPGLIRPASGITDAEGYYRVINLPLGTDTLTADLQRFAGPEPFQPARALQAETPPLSPTSVGWSEAVVVAEIDRRGSASATRPVSGTTQLVEQLQAALRYWQFTPATEHGVSVESMVLVAAVMRPRTLYANPEVGEPPRQFAAVPNTVPGPARTVRPVYPVRAIGDGVVIVEMLVGADGKTTQLRIVASAPGFDGVAADAARQWTFRPAVRDGRSVPAYVYLVLGFRSPVITSRH